MTLAVLPAVAQAGDTQAARGKKNMAKVRRQMMNTVTIKAMI